MSMGEVSKRTFAKVRLASKSVRQFYLEAAALKLLQAAAVGRRPAPRVFVSNDLLGQEILVRGVYEGDELEILFSYLLKDDLPSYRQSVALDVGGNIGNHALFFAPFFRTVLSFEPNPVVFRVLCANLALNRVENVEAFEIGLSDADQKAEFSQLEDENLGSSALSRHVPQSAKRSVVEVELRRGDTFLETVESAGPVGLIKVDVEGHELWVLRGLEGTIQRDHPSIIFESRHRNGEDGGARTVEFLRSCGYTHLYSVSPSYPSVCKLPKPFGTIGGALTRKLRGIQYRIEPLHELEDRHYGTIVALTRPWI